MNKIIFKGISGSKLFGSNNAFSDTDIKEVFIPSSKEILLDTYNPYKDIVHEGIEDKSNLTETSSYSLKYFIHQLQMGSLRHVEMLFTPNNKILEKTKEWDEIIEKKDLLILPQIPTFIKFAQSTLYKYDSSAKRINSFNNIYNILSKDENAKIQNSQNILEQLEDNNFTFNENFFIFHNKKFPLNVKNIEVIKYIDNEMNKLSKRKKENKEFLDWRSLGHAVRIIDEALEYLENGYITFPRHNASFLLDIKKEIIPVEQILNEIQTKIKQVTTLIDNGTYYNSDYCMDKEHGNELIYKYHLQSVRNDIYKEKQIKLIP